MVSQSQVTCFWIIIWNCLAKFTVHDNFMSHSHMTVCLDCTLKLETRLVRDVIWCKLIWDYRNNSGLLLREFSKFVQAYWGKWKIGCAILVLLSLYLMDCLTHVGGFTCLAYVCCPIALCLFIERYTYSLIQASVKVSTYSLHYLTTIIICLRSRKTHRNGTFSLAIVAHHTIE